MSFRHTDSRFFFNQEDEESSNQNSKKQSAHILKLTSSADASFGTEKRKNSRHNQNLLYSSSGHHGHLESYESKNSPLYRDNILLKRSILVGKRTEKSSESEEPSPYNLTQNDQEELSFLQTQTALITRDQLSQQ